MEVALLSAFRDSARTLDAYFNQVFDLGELLGARGDKGHLIWGEGDSTDGTRGMLLKWAQNNVIDVAHGGKYHGSVIHPERSRQLEFVWTKLLNAVPDSADVVVFVESDLLWDAGDMLTLIDQTADYPLVTPMIMLRRAGHKPEQYYDIWASRKDGKKFRSMPPYFSGWPTQEMTRLDSAGSCLVMRAEYARQCSIIAPDVVVEFCRQANAKGGEVWLNPTINVYHP